MMLENDQWCDCRSEHQIIHMFQNASAESNSPEDVDQAAFIQAMQSLRLDRPPDMSSSKGQDGFAYVPQGSKQNRASRIPERLTISESRSGSIASVRDLVSASHLNNGLGKSVTAMIGAIIRTKDLHCISHTPHANLKTHIGAMMVIFADHGFSYHSVEVEGCRGCDEGRKTV